MQFSTYNITNRKCEEIIIHNTLTGIEVSIDEELYEFVTNRCFPKTGEEQRLVRRLKQYGIVVESKGEERKKFCEWLHDEICSVEDLNITLTMTYSCNLSCKYCYLKHLRGDGHKFPAQDAVNWIKKKIGQTRVRTLFVSFFGGEPLIEYDRILFVSTNLDEFCKSVGVDYQFDIATNGTLLKSSQMSSLIPLGLKSVNVTIDGDKNVHDRKRPFRNGRGSFEKIMSNLIKVTRNVKETPINLIVNIRENSQDAVMSLIKAIADKGLKIEGMRFKPIFETEEKKAISNCLFPPGFVHLYRKLAEFASQNGFKVDDNPPVGICGFFRRNTFVIGPDGEIYPCTPFLGNQDYSMGCIMDGGKRRKFRRNGLKLPQKCYNCAYAPICAGGCRFVSYQNTGNVESIACEKRYFNEIFNNTGPY